VRYDPDIHHRRSIRLRGYDYSQGGAYFVTLCTQQREQMLGSIVDDAVRLSPVGEIVQQTWGALPSRFPAVELDAFVIMPDHVHGVLVIEVGEQGAASSAPTRLSTLARVMRAWKSISAIKINRCLSRNNQPVWQRNYYERIIRSAVELEHIRTYIEQNPQRWTHKHPSP